MSQAVPVRSARARTGPPGGGRHGKPPSRADGAGRPRPGQAGAGQAGKAGFSHGGVGTTLVPTARKRNRNERLSRFTRIAERHRASGVSYVPASLTSPGRCPRPGRPPAIRRPVPGPGRIGAATRIGRRAGSGRMVRPVRAGIAGRGVPIPVVGTRRRHLAGIVIRAMGNITRRWSRNDPCGSCGGDGPRRSLVAKRFRGSAQQRRWARWETVSIYVSTTAWRLMRSNSTRKSSAP